MYKNLPLADNLPRLHSEQKGLDIDDIKAIFKA